MAQIRRFLSACFAVLILTVPSLAAAQRVHEVRPAASDEILVGTESGATLRDIVALSRRISGNAELDADDVIMNNDHVRYVCRAHGRQLYFGRDAAYGGDRCPEDASRSRGVLRDSVYRIPRSHGTALPSRPLRLERREVAAPVTTAPDMRVAMLENQVHELEHANENAESRILDALNTADRATAELDELRAHPPAPQVHMEFIHDPAQAEEIAQLRAALAARPPTETPWPLYALAFVLVIAALLVLYGLHVYLRNRALRPHITFGQTQAKMSAERLIDLKEADRVQKEDAQAIKSLRARRRGLGTYVAELRVLRDRQERVLAKALPQLKELAAFQDRRNSIVESNRRIGELRVMDERVEVYRLQIVEAKDYLAEAEKREDAVAITHCQAAIAQCEADLAKIPYDPEEVRNDLRDLIVVQSLELAEQTGIEFDGSATDAWRAEIEAKARRRLMEADAKRQTYEDLAKVVADERVMLAVDNEKELAEKKAALEAEFTAKQAAFEAECTARRTELDEEAKRLREKDEGLGGVLMAHAFGAHVATKDAADVQGAAERLSKKLKENGELLVKANARIVELELREQVLLNGPEAESAQAKLILEYDRKFAHLEEKVKNMGGSWSDPPPPPPLSLPARISVPELGMDEATVPPPAPRHRRPTGSLDRTAILAGSASQQSGTPAPRKEAGLLETMRMYLDESTKSGNGAAAVGKVLHCSEEEGRDLVYFLHNFSVESPLLEKPVRIRQFALAISKIPEKKAWLESRRKTNPPPALR
jgi:hypothetical protein